ncbi:MAG: DEAD/DEAH box helicase family protein, partial [Bacteroidota bacterium]
MDRITLFAEVLLPMPLPGTFTYRIPYELNNVAEPGKRVVVQFGRKKIYTGLIREIHQTVPHKYVPKYVLAVLDNFPVVNALQFRFWDWIAGYYMCWPGEVMNAALPSALKLASETRIVQHPEFSGDTADLNEKEYLVAEAIDIQKTLTLSEVSRIVEFQKVIPLIKTLIEKKVVLVEEEVKERYKPKVDIYVRLSEEYHEEEKLKQACDELEARAYKQLELLMTFLRLSGSKPYSEFEIRQSSLITEAKASAAVLTALEKKGILEKQQKVTSRLEEFEAATSVDTIELTSRQAEVLEKIRTGFNEKKPVLLHGVTSSGKTEVYIKLIEEALKAGKQVLFLLPEIALTTQIINRLRKYFGDGVGVYHSRYNEFERVEIWNRVLEQK